MNRDAIEQTDEDEFIRGFYGIPDDKKLRGMSVVELASLLSSCENGSAKYVMVEEELHRRRSAGSVKRWYEKPVGIIGIGVVIVILGACTVYLIKNYAGIEI